MKKLTISMKVKTIDTEYSIADATAVYGQLLAHKDLEWTASGVDYIVPFHAVLYAIITRSSSTVEAPTDANCKEG